VNPEPKFTTWLANLLTRSTHFISYWAYALVFIHGIAPPFMAAGMLFGFWIKHSEGVMNFVPEITDLTTRRSRLGVDDYRTFIGIALLFLLWHHLVRWFVVAKLATKDREINVNAYLVLWASKWLYAQNWPFLWLILPFFALWIPFGQKVPGSYAQYAVIALIVAAVVFTWYILKFQWYYGYKPIHADRERNRGSNSWTASQDSGQEDAPAPQVARKKMSRITFADIEGNTEIKHRLLKAANAINGKRKEGEVKRNGILLHGEPGNGKTIFAQALAGELKIPILQLTHSDVASQWIGERTVKIKAAFEQAMQSQPCVLFIDEIDSFLGERNSRSNDHKEDTDVVNSLLTLLVDVREHRIIVMAATNFVDRLDGAAIREGRFDFKVEITPPDEEARIGLLTSGLKKHVPKVSVNAATIKTLAQRWNGYSVKRILAVTEELPSYLDDLKAQGQAKTELVFDDFVAALRRIQGRKGAKPENVKPMSEMVFPEVTKEALSMLANRLRNPERVERLGGTLPTGVLFFGPPGTGKTVACKALAKEVDWTFLLGTGPELARDTNALDKLHRTAMDLRPCIIFIDEADDLVRGREISGNTGATNKLLTLMDGVADRVRDVVWIASTNHPDQIDSALLRGGRFTEKVEFVRPDADQLAIYVQSWLDKRKVGVQLGLDAQTIVDLLGDQSIANTEAVLQYAVNRAIHTTTTEDKLVLSLEDVQRGVVTILGETL